VVLGDETPGVDERRVKAAFLLNFARFIEWPARAFASAESPVVVAVIGKDPFGTVLEETLKDKRIGGRPIVIKRFGAVADLEACHLLFVSASLEAEYGKVFDKLKGSPAVTIGETPGFAAKGGIFRLFTQEKKMRFEVNVEASKRAAVTLSSKLLSLGMAVTDAPPEH
jgi:hypothetical protein